MGIRVLRTFANVGQGLFAIEKFYIKERVAFCAVYDCGGKKGTIDQRIQENIGTNLKIDALFISHFDYDHVNGIPYILKNHKVERVYIPLVSGKEKLVLLSYLIASAANKNNVAIELLVRAEEYIKKLNEEAKVFFVGTEDSIKINRNGALENELGASSDRVVWEYILYNLHLNKYKDSLKVLFDKKTRGKILDKIINGSKLKLNKRKFKEFIEEILNKPNELNKLMGNKNANKYLKELYKAFLKECNFVGKIEPNNDKNVLNINSLVVYSGSVNIQTIPVNICGEGINCSFYEFCDEGGYVCNRYYYNLVSERNKKLIKKSGCLFCGDVNGKTKEFLRVLEKYGANLMCMQVPHHGSKYNNNEDTFKYDILYIMCAGKNNRYKHPSWEVLMELINEGKLFKTVNEDAKSKIDICYHIKC